mmetsp:Transcript_16516/g.30058  ORF Transcript_16516/g.30058 Transcript_16516/m.30058 type:complete len:284 (-) Transcript_16516:102-953(-)
MVNLPRKTAESLVEADDLREKKIVTLALEKIVFLFLDDKVNVSRFHLWNFVGHVAKCNFLVVAHALVDMNLQYLALALGFGGISLSSTVVTVALELLDHSWTNLPHFYDHAPSVTRGTFRGFSFDDLAIDGEFDRLAVIEVFEADFEGVIDAGSLAGTGAAAAASSSSKKHGKQVFATPASCCAILAHALQSILVIGRSLFLVAQNLVRRINLLKLVFFPTLVGMVHPRQFSVRLFNFLLVRGLFHLQRLIELGRIHISSSTIHTRMTSSSCKLLKRNTSKHY